MGKHKKDSVLTKFKRKYKNLTSGEIYTCAGQHPGSDCKDNCGCHCQGCVTFRKVISTPKKPAYKPYVSQATKASTKWKPYNGVKRSWETGWGHRYDEDGKRYRLDEKQLDEYSTKYESLPLSDEGDAEFWEWLREWLAVNDIPRDEPKQTTIWDGGAWKSTSGGGSYSSAWTGLGKGHFTSDKNASLALGLQVVRSVLRVMDPENKLSSKFTTLESAGDLSATFTDLANNAVSISPKPILEASKAKMDEAFDITTGYGIHEVGHSVHTRKVYGPLLKDPIKPESVSMVIANIVEDARTEGLTITEFPGLAEYLEKMLDYTFPETTKWPEKYGANGLGDIFRYMLFVVRWPDRVVEVFTDPSYATTGENTWWLAWIDRYLTNKTDLRTCITEVLEHITTDWDEQQQGQGGCTTGQGEPKPGEGEPQPGQGQGQGEPQPGQGEGEPQQGQGGGEPQPGDEKGQQGAGGDSKPGEKQEPKPGNGAGNGQYNMPQPKVRDELAEAQKREEEMKAQGEALNRIIEDLLNKHGVKTGCGHTDKKGSHDFIDDRTETEVNTNVSEELRREITPVHARSGNDDPELMISKPLETSESKSAIPKQSDPLVQKMRAALTFREAKPMYNERLLKDGEIDGDELYRWAVDDYRVFHQEEIESAPKTRLYLLVDCSGSMSGGKLELATRVARLLVESARDMAEVTGIKVFGHTTGGGNVSAIYRIWEKGDKLSRLGTLMTVGHGSNYDGHALAYVVKEMNRDTDENDAQRIIIVLSDGQPAGSGYGGQLAFEHIRSVVDWAAKNDTRVLQIAIDAELRDDEQRAMYREYIPFQINDDLNSVIPKITRWLKRQM